jgi:hypothetical protein
LRESGFPLVFFGGGQDFGICQGKIGIISIVEQNADESPPKISYHANVKI